MHHMYNNNINHVLHKECLIIIFNSVKYVLQGDENMDKLGDLLKTLRGKESLREA